MKAYHIVKTTELVELNALMTELVHEASGAKILHIANDDPENLFCLSFKTLPESSDGVAHILEHTVLCGSKKYPVKDPFFSMTRRSLHTFMNAMTGSDFTCYPASSQVEKDFYNLLDVYIDAVFHPKLEPLSFLQEGIRLEFKDPLDTKSDLEYKGIVYNEMKGALASGSARLSELMNKHLYPNITYGVNSGGDPKNIPELTYEGLVDFHKKYYQPSRCLFFFYGNLPLEKHLQFLDETILKDSPKLDPIAEIPKQPRFSEPKRIDATFPIAEDTSQENRALISFGWLTTSVKDTLDTLGFTVVILAIMDNDASPLKQALLKSGLCKQATAYFDNEMSEAPFVLTVKGCESDAADDLEALIFKTLQQCADSGIPEERVNSVIHQLEFSRSEITGDSHPFGLSLFMRSALLKQHGVEPETGILVHAVFKKLREKMAEDPRYFSSLIEQHLIKNPHWVRIVMTPSTTLSQAEHDEERARLDKIAESLSDQEKEALIEQGKTLLKFQSEQESQDTDILPKVTLEDVPTNGKHFPLDQKKAQGLLTYTYPGFTNEIAYVDVVYYLPQLDIETLPYVRLLSTIMGQMGAGERNYVETLEFIQENTGGIGTGLSFNIQSSDSTSFTPSLHLKGKSLYTKKEKLTELLFDVSSRMDFTDVARFQEILQKHYTGLVESLQRNAMHYAMNLSASSLSAVGRLSDLWFGLEYYNFIHRIKDDPQAVLDQLSQVYDKIIHFAPPTVVVSADKNFIDEGIKTGFWGLSKLPHGIHNPTPWHIETESSESQGRIIASGVAFTSVTLPSIGFDHPDAPKMGVISHLLDNITLHSKIREQGGAYGGGSSSNTSNKQFSFYAYRDPHIASTLKAFQEAINLIAEGDFDDEDLTEAKLEIIQSLDAPVAPGSKADIAYGWLVEGKDYEKRQKIRNQVLNLTKEEISRVTKEVLIPNFDKGITVVFAGKELLEKENAKLDKPLKLLNVS